MSQVPAVARIQRLADERITVICPATYKRGIRFLGQLLMPGSKCTAEASLGLAALALGLEVYGEDGVRVGTNYGWQPRGTHGR